MRTRDFSIVEKKVGETPLQALERFRKDAGIDADTPLAYAGRLDPMASGKLLILIGEECKRQEEYHGLDKEYEFEVLLGISSDSGDILGVVEYCTTARATIAVLKHIAKTLRGNIELPYPHFSSKTVRGKPLHTWTLENRLDEIEIPTYTATIYKLALLDTYDIEIDELYAEASKKIETIAPVTDERKALGNDFRRPVVRASWKAFHDPRPQECFQIARFRCVASAGTYMRTLAEEIARELGGCGLAYSIHRNQIGRYQELPFKFGFWRKTY